MKSKNPQLTYEQRCQIEALNKIGLSQKAIATQVGVNQSTISRELNRNRGKRGYRCQQAQRMAEDRRKAAVKPTKMTPELIALVEAKLRIKWSPEQISGWLLVTKNICLSHESIYLHVWADKQRHGDLYINLRRQGKKYDKRRNGKSTRGHIKGSKSIDERPGVVDRKTRKGDWEIDTVIGKNHSGALVTIVERVTKHTLSKVIKNKTAEAVTQATIELLEPYKEIVHTITADNGKEFSNHREIETALDTQVYFAHPYSSWERGLNENTNGLIRQYFPKSTDFKKVTQADVDQMTICLNNRPRKSLVYQTPNQLMKKHIAAIGI
jgi:transposase, IS30 family